MNKQVSKVSTLASRFFGDVAGDVAGIKRLKQYFIVALCLGLNGCEILLDEALDCINNDEPKFDQATLPDAILNQEYSASLTASIRNNPFDELYHYAFDYIGALPTGISTRHQRGSEILHFEGTPTRLGVYDFELRVIAYDNYYYFDFDQANDYYDDGDSLCRRRHNQRFQIRVIEAPET